MIRKKRKKRGCGSAPLGTRLLVIGPHAASSPSLSCTPPRLVRLCCMPSPPPCRVRLGRTPPPTPLHVGLRHIPPPPPHHVGLGHTPSSCWAAASLLLAFPHCRWAQLVIVRLRQPVCGWFRFIFLRFDSPFLVS